MQVGPKTLFPDRGDFTPPVGAALPRNEVPACELPDLPPLASTVLVDIAPGRPPKKDAGGKALVVGYGQARDAIHACKER